jgi:hypothetical protein
LVVRLFNVPGHVLGGFLAGARFRALRVVAVTAKIHGFTVKTFDESDGEPRLLGSSIHFGGAPRWVLLDDEALAGFVQKERSPWGHCWLSSRDLAEDAAREVRGIVCAVEVDEGGAVTVREIDPVAEAVLAEREACAKVADDYDGRNAPEAIAARIRARGQK